MADVLGRPWAEWTEEFPLIDELVALRQAQWFNPDIRGAAEGLAEVGMSPADIQDAADRLKRWAPYLALVFPEARPTAGILESPLVAVPAMQQALENRRGREIPGQLWAKLDSHLPISGSIKARGGVYEVLKHAEDLALAEGLITLEDDYRKLASDEAREFFSRHRVAVGSTGNLGLSIGVMSAQLGFTVSVHMSADAREWKKERLRSHGVDVVEYDSDYSAAVEQGRREAEADPRTHFVDDENSPTLFLGYAVAGARLAGQLQALDVRVAEDSPLIVYLPCGVGGGPGGVAFGLKAIFGDAVRCLFVEPTHSPAMLLGMMTGLHDEVSVQDFGIDNVTAADGLAVGRPSAFVGKRMQRLIDGCLTVSDDEMFRNVALLAESEGFGVEPSSSTAFAGPLRVLAEDASGYRDRAGLTPERLKKATHLAWITGGSMVPEEEMEEWISRGGELL